MDYGDRQTRAEMLVKSFRKQGDKVYPLQGYQGRTSITGAEMADEIEKMTPVGRNIVAVAGLVIEAARNGGLRAAP